MTRTAERVPEDGSKSVVHYLHVLRRRFLVVALTLLLVPAAAVLVSAQQEPRYEASAEVLLSRQNLAAALTNVPDAMAYQEPSRLAQTQAELARAPALAERVIGRAEVGEREPAALLQSSSVRPQRDADVLLFTVEDDAADAAVALANAYATEYTVFRREFDTETLEQAGNQLRARIAELERSGVPASSEIYGNLVDKEQQLATMQALQTANTRILRLAATADQISPQPVRNGALGLFLGLVLGIAFAFLWDSLDRRIRNERELEGLLRMPLLGRVARRSRRATQRTPVLMLEEPTGVHAELYRTLRTNVEFSRLDTDVRSIMVTSALEAEGKSTTLANLAVAYARAGAHVVVVDLDLRKGSIAGLFGLGDNVGLSNVAIGAVSLDKALQTVVLPDATEPVAVRTSGNGRGHSPALLEVLATGPFPPDPGEFVATRAVSEILETLRDRADIVLVDAPPLLAVGDPLVLSDKVDGLIVVSRVKLLERPMVEEMRRLLDSARARVLGFVVADADPENISGYGAAYGYARPQARTKAKPAAGTARR